MFGFVVETSYQSARRYFRFVRNEFDGEHACVINCPYLAKIAAVGFWRMIESTAKVRSKVSEKMKNFMQGLRWFLCATIPESLNGPGQNNKFVVETVREEDSVTSPSETEKRSDVDVVTFQHLPPECKMKVFSYLTIEEKGQAERVCSEWKDLIRTPMLWDCVDLTRFSLSCQCPGRGCSNVSCYDSYKDRTEQFLDYLAKIRPNLKEFRFAYDINDCQDDWLRVLRSFVDSVHLHKLRVAQLNWKETPVKPYPSESITWSSNNYNDLMYRHRRRQRHFVAFFDLFTASARNLTTLILPFDWSASSIRCLSRLHRLETLVLESYFIPQPLQQETIDELLVAVPNLKHLTVTVCIGSGLGTVAFKLASKKLESLDVSGCQGFCLDEVNLPALTDFRTSAKSYVGPLLDFTSSLASTPCIYEVLCAGAPSLVRLNDHRLRSNWRENRYAELDVVLKNICACAIHKPV